MAFWSTSCSRATTSSSAGPEPEGPVEPDRVITFDGPPAPVVASHVSIANTAFNYSLDIDDSEQKSLGDGFTPEVQSETGGPVGPLPPPQDANPEAPQADPRLYTPPSAD